MPFVDIADIKIFFEKSGQGDLFMIFPDNILSSKAYQSKIQFFSKSYEVIALTIQPLGNQLIW